MKAPRELQELVHDAWKSVLKSSVKNPLALIINATIPTDRSISLKSCILESDEDSNGNFNTSVDLKLVGSLGKKWLEATKKTLIGKDNRLIVTIYNNGTVAGETLFDQKLADEMEALKKENK